MKRCSRCGQDKPLEVFRQHSQHKHLKLSWCRDCEAEARKARYAALKDDPGFLAENRRRAREWRQRNPGRAHDAVAAWRAANPERVRAYSKKWKQANREYVRLEAHWRRTKKREGDLTLDEWRDLCAAYGERCAYCHRKPPKLTMDHVVPLSRGGRHTKTNVVPACMSCNQRKGVGAPPTYQPILA